ncbi:MAG: alpha-amylase family glycosyl hydrolase [Terriglobia bacterium]
MSTSKLLSPRFLCLAVCLFLSLWTLSAAQHGAPSVASEVARPVPAWVRDGVIYEIFPRDFSPEGNFNGITARLDDLRDLGVTIVWLMPIHPVGQEGKKGTLGSPYAVRDYYSINPNYGTKNDLHRLIAEAHHRGLKVTLDMVANHTAWDSVMMKNPDFYRHDASGKIVSPVPDWSDVAALNYDSPRLRDYMVDMLKYWLREFNLDGFRCDVAGMIPTDFWEHARQELQTIKPDLLMLAEADKPDLLVKAFDLDYAWPFHAALTKVIIGDAPATALHTEWQQERATFPRGALHMRFSDNHDELRAIVRFGERGALAASALILTMDGVPLIYNGMETGDTTESAAPALFERMPIFWKIAERRTEFSRFYHEMIALRRAHPALRQGETEWVRNSDEARVATYFRRTGSEEFLVAINLSNRPFEGTLELRDGSSFLDVTPKSYASSNGDNVPRRITLPGLNLDAWGFRVFQRSSPH